MEYQSGQVVYSKSGHDKGDTLMVLFVEGAYVYLADGKRRKIEKDVYKRQIQEQKNSFASEYWVVPPEDMQELADVYKRQGHLSDHRGRIF